MRDFDIGRHGVLTKYMGNGGDVVIPDIVKRIEDCAFRDCSSLKSITIPEGVTSIGRYAFFYCSSLKSITIPESVTSIGERAFQGCSSLTSITIPEGVKRLDFATFSLCHSLTSVTIPESLKSIGSSVFSDCRSLTSITIPEGVTSIGEWAFEGCRSLTSITIPESVTSIGRSAFSDCSSLKSIIVSENNPVYYSAGDCLITRKQVLIQGCVNSVIPDCVASIEDCAFRGCRSLTSITIPEGVTSIGRYAFLHCSGLKSITIPESVTSIGEWAFRGCSSLKSIIVSENNPVYYSAGDCLITRKQVLIQGCVNSVIPDCVTSIGANAFADCSHLKSITIPESVETIGSCAFTGCKALSQVEMKGKHAELAEDAFDISSLAKTGAYQWLDDRPLRDKLTNKEKSLWSLLSNEQRQELFLARQSKILGESYQRCVTKADAAMLTDVLLQKLAAAKPSAKEIKAAENLLLTCEKKLSEESMRKIYMALKGIKSAAKTVAAIEADGRVMQKIGVADEQPQAERTPEEQIVAEEMARENMFTKDLEQKLMGCYALKMKDLPDILSADGRTEPKSILAWLLTAHEGYSKYKGWGGTFYTLKVLRKTPGISAPAQKVLSYLDQGKFQQALKKLADTVKATNGRNTNLVYPLSRYADDALMDEMMQRTRNWSREPKAIFLSACVYSEYRPVMMFAEKNKCLDDYAKVRGTDAQTIRDTQMADFGFDSEGRKTYDLGGTTIIVQLQKDLSMTLFDTKQDKEVKSMPKRGNEEALVSTAAADFSELKKNVKKIVRNRFAQLFRDFLSGQTQEAQNWKAAYLNNPVLRTTASSVVWQQGKATFTLLDGQPIRADGKAYTIGASAIAVAHPMEMAAEDVQAWQQYFLAHGIKQPFEQVWEPVIDPTTIRKDRYKGVEIPFYRFAGAEKHGVIVDLQLAYSEVHVWFEGCNAKCVSLDFERHEISKDHRFEVTEFGFPKYTRQANHIVAYLDKITIYNRIATDDAAIVQYLHGFTLAQITKFIAYATEKQAAQATAALLEYKQQHYPDIDPMTEFTLDW